MRTPTYRVQLTPEDRTQLEGMLRKGKHRALELKRAQALLMADAGRSNQLIHEVTGMCESAIIGLKKRYAQEGLCLRDKPRRPRRSRLDCRQEAYLIAIACGPPPTGRERWTMQLLADRLVELDVVETISDETVRLALKKNRLNLGSKTPGASAAK